MMKFRAKWVAANTVTGQGHKFMTWVLISRPGATRYRTEDYHPEYTGGQSGPSGSGLKSTYTGYKFIKWNRGQFSQAGNLAG